jgi:glucose/arabinose dehydrogenase
VRLALCVALGVLSAGCRQFTEVTDHRVDPKPPKPLPATGLTFPLDPPSPTPLATVRAFPKLTFDRPVFITDAPDDRNELYVLEQSGRIFVFENRDDVETAEVFLDIRDRVRMQHNEEGLLGLAFAPDYARSGVFYLYFSASDPRRAQISRFNADGDRRTADPSSEEPLLAVNQPYGNHNGGTVLSGPDGMLYAGFGDGGAAGDPEAAGQDLGTLLAKIVRLEVGSDGPYRVPPDNPFVDVAGARPEIWAYGLRNPWRFSFDRQTGALWAGDVGQDSLEEVDIVVRGGNFGWRHREGTRDFLPEGQPRDPYIDPVVEYGRRLGESITGGYVYRGTHLSAFRGVYFYGDYVTGNVWALTHDGKQTTSNELVARVPALSSFGEDAAGELYAVNLDGRLYRFEPEQERDAAPAFPTKLSQTGLFADTATLAPTAGLRPYDLRWPFWSDGASKRRWLVLPQGGRIEFDREARGDSPRAPWW